MVLFRKNNDWAEYIRNHELCRWSESITTRENKQSGINLKSKKAFFHTMHKEITEFIDKVYCGDWLTKIFKSMRKGRSSIPKHENLD